jgi:hypothetical protein
MIDADLDLTIDRIVDGGLSPARLREAAARLDAVPDGWKQCALAFLEAQSWADALREPSRPRVAPPAPPAPAPRSRRVRPSLAAAAALGAFAMGGLTGARPERPGERPQPPPIVQARTLDEPTVARIDEPDPIPEEPPPAIREVARLRIATGPHGESTAEVPILAGPGLDSDWLMNQPMPVSEDERAELERQGFALDQERELVAMPLGDGRRVVVPVDQVQLRYVGAVPL